MSIDRWEVKFFKWIVGRLLLFCLVLALLPTVFQLIGAIISALLAFLSALLAFILPWVIGLLVVLGCAAAVAAILAFWCRFVLHKGG